MPRTHCHCALHIPRWISPEATIEKYSFLGKCVCGIFATPSWFPFHRQTSAFDQSFPFSLHDRVQWSTPCWIWWAKTWNLLPELFKLTHAHPMTLAKFVTRAFRTRWICDTKCTKRNILRPSTSLETIWILVSFIQSRKLYTVLLAASRARYKSVPCH